MSKLVYSEVIKNRVIISTKFPVLERRGRVWRAFGCTGVVLNLGSGNVTCANHREIASAYSDCQVFSCDSDQNSGADWTSLEEATSSQKYDLIVAEHFLEHIDTQEFADTLSVQIVEAIKPKGTLVITIPNIYCFGTFFSDYDHKNFASPVDIAAIFCCRGLEIVDFFRWSKPKQMMYQENMTEVERFVESFIEKNYGLQTDRYVTMVFRKREK